MASGRYLTRQIVLAVLAAGIGMGQTPLQPQLNQQAPKPRPKDAPVVAEPQPASLVSKLPHTASTTPLVATVGLLSLLAAAGIQIAIRIRSRRGAMR